MLVKTTFPKIMQNHVCKNYILVKTIFMEIISIKTTTIIPLKIPEILQNQYLQNLPGYTFIKTTFLKFYKNIFVKFIPGYIGQTHIYEIYIFVKPIFMEIYIYW